QMSNSLIERTGLFLLFLASICSPVFARSAKITGTNDNLLADAVLRSLLATPLGRTAPHVRYQVILLNDPYANALTNTRGKIYITSGLLPALDHDRGVWAAVISHELGHTFLHHPRSLPRFEAALSSAYQKARAEGYSQGPSSLPNLHLGRGISGLTLSREEEVQADLIGLMLMAEAGYQPAFTLLLDQRLQYALGDEPGFVAIFSHHPRLETREKHNLEYSAEATDIFRSRWPDVAKSPGGNLPPYGSLGSWTLRPAAGGERLVFSVPFKVHNAEGMNVRVAAAFLDHGVRVPAKDPKYRAIDGSLVVNAYLPGAVSESNHVKLSVPVSAIDAPKRKLQAVVFLMAGNRLLDVSRLAYSLPKN
ncbi:MAG TPA: M48 family metalloprotease, partial [Terriglobia bacterium]|nr:M48 family metalloprotease [Terriglobia bacterium]